MPLIRDDDYEEMAATFQCIQIKELNDVLKRHGIVDAKQREEICADYLFSIGEFLDQQWFECEGKRLHPMLCFSETFLNTDTNPEDLGDLYLCSDMFSYHEYAHGNISYFFEEHGETIPDLVTGSVGEDS